MPVIPNETIVEGTVVEYAILSSSLEGIHPPITLHRVTILIESTRAVEGKADFLSGREGEYVPFYTKEGLSPTIFGKRIRARARFRGDERGGRFWIYNTEETNKP